MRSGLSPEHPLRRERLADGAVDLPPQFMGRGDQQGSLPDLGFERQPGFRRLLAEIVIGDLVHAAVEQLHRLAGIARQNRLHRGQQGRVPLAQDFVHPHRRHPRPLQQPERLSRLHRAGAVWCRPPGPGA